MPAISVWIVSRIRDLIMPIIQMYWIPALISVCIGILSVIHRAYIYKLERYLTAQHYLDRQRKKRKLETELIERAEKYQ